MDIELARCLECFVLFVLDCFEASKLIIGTEETFGLPFPFDYHGGNSIDIERRSGKRPFVFLLDNFHLIVIPFLLVLVNDINLFLNDYVLNILNVLY